jgi:hypothetical protein
MNVLTLKRLIAPAAALLMLASARGEGVPPSPDIANSIYQFGVVIPKSGTDPLIWNQTNAFLWVPPDCRHIRALILAPSNVIERRFCDDPIVRAEAARDGLAIVFFNAGWKKEIFDTPDCITYVETILDALADKSGYQELRTVPWIPFGHSGNSSSSQAMAQWDPGRTLANIVVKGKIPGVGKDGSKAAITGIPTLFVTGEFEEVMPPGGVRNAWWTRQMQLFHEGRAAVPDSLMTGLEDRSRGHLAWFPDTSGYAALFIHKAVEARLGEDGKLKPVSFESGWLADPDGKFPAAPVAKYTGKPSDAFWFFDQGQELAWEPLQHRDEGKKEQLVALVQDGQIAPWWKGWRIFPRVRDISRFSAPSLRGCGDEGGPRDGRADRISRIRLGGQYKADRSGYLPGPIRPRGSERAHPACSHRRDPSWQRRVPRDDGRGPLLPACIA